MSSACNVAPAARHMLALIKLQFDIVKVLAQTKAALWGLAKAASETLLLSSANWGCDPCLRVQASCSRYNNSSSRRRSHGGGSGSGSRGSRRRSRSRGSSRRSSGSSRSRSRSSTTHTRRRTAVFMRFGASLHDGSGISAGLGGGGG